MNYKSNLNNRLAVAVILTIVGSGLLIAGFIVPPLGIIDSYKYRAYKNEKYESPKRNDK